MTPRHSDGGPDATHQMPPLSTGEAPAVSTAPPIDLRRRWWSAVPHHLGRARTSTVVLAVLFLAIGTLYLYVRPESTASTSVDPAGGTSVPAPETGQPTEPAEPAETSAPTETTEPTETGEPTTAPETTTPTPSRTPSAPARTPEEAPEEEPTPTTEEEPPAVEEEPEPTQSPLTTGPATPSDATEP
ncbi:hypothetical protein ACI782_13495 [Geodermatophilus sp. SYSU D00703]